jgi:hypothetical protein
VDYYYPTLFRFPPAGQQPAVRVRKTFVVIKQSIRPFDSRSGPVLPARAAAGKTIRHILVFDDHPDSLRLVFGRRRRPRVDRPRPTSGGWWEPILGGLLITGALILMFLPLYLKLPS